MSGATPRPSVQGTTGQAAGGSPVRIRGTNLWARSCSQALKLAFEDATATIEPGWRRRLEFGKQTLCADRSVGRSECHGSLACAIVRVSDAVGRKGAASAAPERVAAPKKDAAGKARKIIAGTIGRRGAGGRENLASVGHRVQVAHFEIDLRCCGRANLSLPVETSGGFDFRKERDAVQVRRDDVVPRGTGVDNGSAL